MISLVDQIILLWLDRYYTTRFSLILNLRFEFVYFTNARNFRRVCR